ncbi:YlxR family protein [Arcanobacterium pluranimalium]|uniref:YlxR family protein n=1 Tax=Arcanobacterium pluranimalium TaxID=108028 RepID=UPI001958F05B
MSKFLSATRAVEVGNSRVSQAVRTCIGCRKKDVSSQMLRLKAVQSGAQLCIRIDHHSQIAGRGAWIHNNLECFTQASKRRAFSAAFRASSGIDICELTNVFNCQISTNNESG